MHIWQLALLVLALVLAVGSLLVAIKLMRIVKALHYRVGLVELMVGKKFDW